LVLLAISNGCTNAAAARAAGISPTTVRKYLADGKAHIEAGNTDSPEAKFFEALESARANAICDLRAIIFKASVKEWRAAACLLERIDPTWKREHRQELPEPKDPPVEASSYKVTFNVVVAEPVDSTLRPTEGD
jgi:hypothetical protein